MEKDKINVNKDDTQATGTNDEKNNSGAEDQKTNEGVITLSQEELAELVAKKTQSEVDRRVTQAVKKVSEKYEQQLSLSKLDEDKRAVAEKDIRIQELENQLKEYTILQNKNEVTKTLAGRGLSPEFADILIIGDDIDVAQKNIETLDKLFKDAVAEEVKKKLASTASTPVNGQSDKIAAMKENFKNMSLAEQSKLYQEDKELYEKLLD